jgi:cytochrome c oxidase subunit I+III
VSVQRARSGTDVLDVSALPSYRYGPHTLMWWGTMGLVAIEGTVFALAAFAYFYVRATSATWPPGAPPPDLTWGTLNLVIMLASLYPNHVTKKVAEQENLPAVRRWMAICLVFAVAFLIVRIFEYRSLNVGWDTNAYGSAVWMLLSLHTLHLVTDVYDTVVLLVLMHTGPLEGKRFVDVSENAMYWYFVVFAWVPIYAIIYLVSRS